MSSKVPLELNSSLRVQERSAVDIMAKILKEAGRGARKTRIMYRCNLSHRQLQVYLKLLLDLKLLVSRSGEPGDEKYLYETTTRGRNFLDDYSKLKELMRADAKRDTYGK